MLALILSALGLSGGLGAIAYFMGPSALIGIARSIWGFLAKIPWQIYLAAALAGLIAFLMISRSHALERAQAAESRNAEICAAIRQAAGRPHQDCRLGERQIQAFAKSIGNLEGALADQNDRIRELGRKNAALQSAAQLAKRQAANRASEAESIAARLKASSSKAPAQPCAVSKVLEEQWK